MVAKQKYGIALLCFILDGITEQVELKLHLGSPASETKGYITRMLREKWEKVNAKCDWQDWKRHRLPMQYKSTAEIYVQRNDIIRFRFTEKNNQHADSCHVSICTTIHYSSTRLVYAVHCCVKDEQHLHSRPPE